MVYKNCGINHSHLAVSLRCVNELLRAMFNHGFANPDALVGAGSIRRLLKELYRRIVNLEFESLGISVTEMYHF